MDRITPREGATRQRAALAVLLVGFLPWSVILEERDVAFVMVWGLFRPSSLHVHTLYTLLTDSWPSYWVLPHSLRIWPVGTGLYCLALVSAFRGMVGGNEDGRVTGGLLVLAGLAALWVSVGLALRSGTASLAIPVGAVGLWFVAWRWYGSALRTLFR